MGDGPKFSIPHDSVSQYLFDVTDLWLVNRCLNLGPLPKNIVLSSSSSLTQIKSLIVYSMGESLQIC